MPFGIKWLARGLARKSLIRGRGLRLFAMTVLCLAVPAAARAQAAAGEPLPAGKLIESVAVRGDASQSYALYLPGVYAPERKWPVLVCFDPLARGRATVARFQAAAEEYGFVVLGSNNSRNGLDGAALSKIINALWAGGHEWPPKEVCEKALAWFRLREMRSGQLARDDKFIDAQLASRLGDAQRRLAGRQYVDAYESYLAVVRDFQGWRDVGASAGEAVRLKNSSELKGELRSEAELE